MSISTSQPSPGGLPGEGCDVALYPLTFLEENGEVVVGRTDIDSYGVFPPEGAALLRQLAAGMETGAATRWYADTYGEQVDIADFLATLDELEFLVRGTDSAVEAGHLPPLRWQRLGRWAFSPVAWVCYLLVLGTAAAAMAARPRLVPHPGNLFFTPYVTALALTLFLGQFPFLLLHEGFHLLAGRRLGLRSSMRLGRRLYYILIETTMDGLVAVPRRQRYLPMLAGMLADLLVIAVLTLVADLAMGPGGHVSLLGGACLALAFTTLLRFAWQFCFYLRTDLYYTIVTVLGCLDLQAAARVILVNRGRRLLGRPLADESRLHPRDRQVGRWYSWLVPVGYAFSLSMLALTVIPPTVRILAEAIGRLAHPGQPGGEIVDAAVFLGLNLAQLVIIAVLIMRSRRSRRLLPAAELAHEGSS
jgi:hypothetical protein